VRVHHRTEVELEHRVGREDQGQTVQTPTVEIAQGRLAGPDVHPIIARPGVPDSHAVPFAVADDVPDLTSVALALGHHTELVDSLLVQAVELPLDQRSTEQADRRLALDLAG
jgi:hypothetical protein